MRRTTGPADDDQAEKAVGRGAGGSPSLFLELKQANWVFIYLLDDKGGIQSSEMFLLALIFGCSSKLKANFLGRLSSLLLFLSSSFLILLPEQLKPLMNVSDRLPVLLDLRFFFKLDLVSLTTLLHECMEHKRG